MEPTTCRSAQNRKAVQSGIDITISSGAEVAKELTVIPINDFGILSFKDKATAAFQKSNFPSNQ